MTINVVYIDDEFFLCDIFKEFLNSSQIHVTTFANENNAIEYCNKHDIDFIFIDYRLSNSTGIQVSQAITSPAIRYIITGELDVIVDESFSGIIEKPFKLEEIKQLILSTLLL